MKKAKTKNVDGMPYHRIEPASVDIYGTTIMGRGLHELNNQKVTIVGNQVTVRKQYNKCRVRNKRIFYDHCVKVMTRENGHYQLVAEIDPKEARKCAKTRKTITLAIDTALAHFENGTADEDEQDDESC